MSKLQYRLGLRRMGCGCETLETRAMLSGEPAVLADLNTSAEGENPLAGPSVLGYVGDVALLAANDGLHGWELWRSDGTDAGTQLVADLAPGPVSSIPSHAASLPGHMFFLTNGSQTQAWQTDGTAAGTVPLETVLFPGNAQIKVVWLAKAGDSIYLSTAIGDQPAGIWRTDGTAAGTSLIVPDAQGDNFTAVGNRVFFTRYLPETGFELWVTDDTPAGAHLVKELAEGPASAALSSFQVQGGRLYFVNVQELWQSDGTDAGTQPVAEALFPGQDVKLGRVVAPLGDWLYFGALTSDRGFQLWRAHADGSGGELAADLPNLPSAALLGAFGDRLYLQFGLRLGTGEVVQQLWASDGTTAGTVNVATGLREGPTRIGDATYFSASNDDAGAELWTTDGSIAGTHRLLDLNPGPGDSGPRALAPLGGGALFHADDGQHGRALWFFDPASGQARLVKDIRATNNGSIASANQAEFARVGGFVYFNSDRANQPGLWRTDGTAAGTTLVYATTHRLTGLTALGDRLLFASDETSGNELWISDGTSAGTHLLDDIQPGSSGSSPTEGIVLQGQMYFFANDGKAGTELWTSDGTAEGTHLAVDLVAGKPDASPWGLRVVDGRLYFQGLSPAGDAYVLWTSDGTPAGTHVAAQPKEGAVALGIGDVFALHGQVYLVAYLNDSGSLWKLDDSEQGAAPVSLFPDPAPSLQRAWAVGDSIFFATGGGAGGEPPLELWKSDGTPGGTHFVYRFAPAASGSTRQIEGGVDLGGTFFFKIDPTGDFQEMALWRSDGTEAGTKIVARYAKGDGGSGNGQMGELFALGDQLFYYAEALGLGLEPHLLTATPGDTNWDGLVDLSDFATLKAHFGQAGGLAQGDLDGNGRIDLSDFGALKGTLGVQAAPASAPAQALAASDWVFAAWHVAAKNEVADDPV